ncbi:MAG: alpha/beta fold hydrolase [Chloroflexi bacterium]|nr:alpha/beta fold hydrolase [Chloroflexota bacterium]
MPKARVNGIELYYEVHGEGEPLLLIRGLGGHLAEVPFLVESYRRHFRVIAFDSRGCGRSDKPEEDYSIAGFADDTAALLDALGIAEAVVHGSSMGGMIAQELALLHPQKVRALVLACTTAGAAGGVAPAMETIQKMVRNQSLSGDEAIAAGWELGYSASYIATHSDEMMARSRIAGQYAAPRDAYMRQVIAAAKHNTYDRLHQVTCPAMIIHGSADVMIPPANAHLLKQHIPHAELHILEGMGHGYELEAQEQSDALVIDFAQRHSRMAEGSARAAR